MIQEAHRNWTESNETASTARAVWKQISRHPFTKLRKGAIITSNESNNDIKSKTNKKKKEEAGDGEEDEEEGGKYTEE
jgi:hypothetical protein